MEILYLLVPIGLVILGFAIKLLFWAINSGQYDDLDMEGHRILFDDDPHLSDKPLSKPAESNPAELNPTKNSSTKNSPTENKPHNHSNNNEPSSSA